MNTLFSLLGAIIILIAGAILGFWIEVLTTPELTNGFKNCSNCGPTFAQTERFWRNERTPKKSGQ